MQTGQTLRCLIKVYTPCVEVKKHVEKVRSHGKVTIENVNTIDERK